MKRFAAADTIITMSMITGMKSTATADTITITMSMMTGMKSTAAVGTITITKAMMMTMAAAPNTIIIMSTPNTTTVRHQNPPVWST